MNQTMKSDRPFFKKFLMRSAWFLLAMLAIFAASYTVLDIKWGCDLKRELDSIRASVAPMTVKDISPPPLPPAEDASVEYRMIFSLMTDGTFSNKRSGHDSVDMNELYKLCMSSKSTEEFDGKCRNNSARIREILDKESFKRIFELCQEASSKPAMNFNIDYGEDPSLLLPHMSSMRGIIRLICLKAEMELLGGQRDMAWETVLTGLKLSSHLKTEPLLISQVIYFASENFCFDFISHYLPRYGISDTQAAKLISELSPERTAYAQSMKKAIDAERICLGSAMFERMLSGNMTPAEMGKLLNSPHPGAFITSCALYLYRPFARKDYLEYLKIMEGYTAEYNQPYFRLTTSFAKDDEKILASIPRYCIFTRLTCPALGKLRIRASEIFKRSLEMQLRLALEEYKNLKGVYPDKLEQLVPQFLAEIPVSDVTGHPFEYSMEKDGYKISGGVTAKK